MAVGIRTHRVPGVALTMTVAVVLGERVVGTVRAPDDDPAKRPLDRVGGGSLQGLTGLERDDEPDNRPDQRRVLEDLDQPFETDVKVVGQDVGGARDGEDREEDDPGYSYAGPERLVPRSVQQVVGAVVVVDLLVEPGPGVDQGEDESGQSMPGKNGLAISWPHDRNSQCGHNRTEPSSHPRYQSGWEPIDTL